eukprot:5057163-Pyramimonas_sp.AAC.1
MPPYDASLVLVPEASGQDAKLSAQVELASFLELAELDRRRIDRVDRRAASVPAAEIVELLDALCLPASRANPRFTALYVSNMEPVRRRPPIHSGTQR